MIDEAQDFEKEWFDLLTKFLSKNNEILLVADDKQNVYEKYISWLNDTMANFKGRWGILKTSIRQNSSPEIIKKANEFSNLFLKDYLEKNPDKALGFIMDLDVNINQPSLFHSLYWKDVIGINSADLSNQLYVAYRFLIENERIESKDIAILLPNRSVGNSIVDFFNKNKKIETADTFKYYYDSSRKIYINNKEFFDMRSDKLKISTIESFKGLEVKAVIYLTSSYNNIKVDIETYIAITRAKSYLIVFNQNEKYRAYGAKWHKLDDEFKATFGN